MPASANPPAGGGTQGAAPLPEILWNGPAGGPTLVLAHGAGAPMDSPFLADMAAGLAGHGVRVARFEFPYMRARRDGGSRRAPDREPELRRSWLATLATLETLEAIAAIAGPGGGARLWIGGKSMGGRIASMVADEAGVRGLVCLGYPFCSPGAAAAAAEKRTAHLRTLRTPALIVQGTRDPFGGPAAVAGYTLAAGIRMQWIEDGDHSFAPRKSSGRTAAQNLAEAVAAVAGFVLG